MPTHKSLPHHIIAIGASAGGLNEINLFFDHTPMDEVSYVIIQHLSPDFKSRMVELLGRHSKLEVKEAEDNMAIECNQVYLIPSDKFMTIKNGSLHLTDKKKKDVPHLTINTFFKSLSSEMGKNAIAIILSGTGSDGSEGVEAIKKNGGLVLASDPALAEFSDMPSNAIATGAVDYVLSPQVMPHAIEYYINSGGMVVPGSFQDDGENKIMNAIINLIKDQLPLDFTDYKQATILRRIKRRAATNNFKKLSDYLQFVKTNNEEVEALAKDFLISVTSFFRDKEAFDFLATDVIPKIISRTKPGGEIKFWVAGCATGEEAYSLAILLAEQLTGKHKDTVVKIFATDIDTNALMHAGKGVYNEQITKAISPARLKKFFTEEGNKYKVRPCIRKMLIFAQHDLVQNPPYCNMDFISCRNLLIYMSQSLQKKIFLTLHFGLKKDGYLFLGSSETPLSISADLEVIHKKFKIYKNKGEKEVVRFDAFSFPALGNVKAVAPNRLISKNAKHKPDITESVNEELMNEFGSLLICIDEQNNVIKTYGDTSRYLLQKNFHSNLADLLPRPLAVAFFTASQVAIRNNEKKEIAGIRIKENGNLVTVNLLVKPMKVNDGEQKLFIVLISDEKITSDEPGKMEVFDEKIYDDKYIISLEKELKALRHELNDAFEKLDASNENMQSFNEELLSANEEMQSSNEEMQSINEELHTINVDYELKNKELIETNDDLNNYFRSNINGQLFVNKDLLLVKFSPGTVKHINIRDNDIGRPLSDISTNIKFETITNDIKRVITNGEVITKEIEATNGKWYQLMTMPYIRKSDNKTDGAIITFNDITELKLTQIELDNTNKSLIDINADLDNFVYTASHDLLGPLSTIEMSITVMNQLEISDNADLRKFLEIINSSIKKFHMLVSEMAVIGKVESGISILEPVDFNELIEDVTLSIEDKINSTETVIQNDLGVAEIYFSKKNLRSILYNLISNAIKFRDPVRKNTLFISTRAEEGYILLSVEDNGIGIPAKDSEKIFQMYGRLENNVDGQGIGLYLVKKILRAAGGKIILKSEPGKGSTFTIYFKDKQPALAETIV